MTKDSLRTQSAECLSRWKVWVLIRSLLLFVVVCSVLCSTHHAGAGKGRVQVGYCAKLAEIDAAKAAGFDYVELRTSEIVALPEPDFEILVAKLKQLQLPVPVAYQFIPASIRLTGPSVNKDEQMRYVRTAFDRLSRLGTEVVVFGSGPARRVPEGFSHQEALQQLIEFCRRIGPEARARKITIAIEAQRKQETNIINNLQEGLELIKAVNDPNIELIVDFYHLAEEKEDPGIISVARNHIRHLHMANPVGRVFPLSSKEYEYDSFFRNLAKIGYDKRISIEAASTDFSHDAPVAIEFLRRSFEKGP
jgi:D-psicose/D-tagatose/L-ribulose 3-epimerase